MKRHVWAITLGTLLTAAGASAQDVRITGQTDPNAHISLGQLAPTPEMWFYEQERQAYMTPAMAVRRKAEVETAQRDARIASRRFFGMSAARPRANPTPLFGSYSPAWVGNQNDRNLWTAERNATVPLYTPYRAPAQLNGLW